MEEGFFFFRNVEISSFFSTSLHSNLFERTFFSKVSNFLGDQLLKLLKERVVFIERAERFEILILEDELNGSREDSSFLRFLFVSFPFLSCCEDEM